MTSTGRAATDDPGGPRCRDPLGQHAHVAKWWDERRSAEQVADHYLPGHPGRGGGPLLDLGGQRPSVGFRQDYRIADHPEFALLCGRPDAIGFDYVIGEPAFVDRGLGTKLLWVFLRDLVLPAYDAVTRAVRRADHRNARSLRVLEKLGATQGLLVRRAAVGRQRGHRRRVQHRGEAGTEAGMTIRVGISGWRYPPWRGDFYPKGLPQRRELEYAAPQLTSIEINGSFYSLQRPSSYAKWRAEVPDDFVFAVKGGRFITHLKRLRDVEVPLANFFASGVLALDDDARARSCGSCRRRSPTTRRCCATSSRCCPRTTTEAARLATRHDDKLSGDKLWSGEVAERPLRYALEPRHQGFAADEALAHARRSATSPWWWRTPPASGRGFEQAVGPVVYVRLHGDTELYASGYTDAALDRVGRPAARVDRGRPRRLRLLRQRHQGPRPARRRKLIAKTGLNRREAAHSRVARRLPRVGSGP